MSKAIRQRRILDLVTAEPIATQDELRKSLVHEGFRVTQATLSRDIADLGLLKTPEGYMSPADEDANVRTLPSLERLLREFVVEVRPAGNLLVIKTAPGAAQPVAAAIDGEGWKEILGTIGGDDAILVITKSRPACRAVVLRIREVIA